MSKGKSKYVEPTYRAFFKATIRKGDPHLLLTESQLIPLVFARLRSENKDQYPIRTKDDVLDLYETIQSGVSRALKILTSSNDNRVIRVGKRQFKLNQEQIEDNILVWEIMTKIIFLKKEVFDFSPTVFVISVSNSTVYYAEALFKRLFINENIYDIFEHYDKIFFCISDAEVFKKVKDKVTGIIEKGFDMPKIEEDDEELLELIDSYLIENNTIYNLENNDDESSQSRE